ncbi:hypothetical protein [Phyllobacterium myrsinacearum]|uniref:Uncharacterized protein n=1 Tax=Phyllobacterium myrsinacearum TaxID=28101 RepID=A0A839EMX5_9HYPH|nr:hypothetical protein [Phyllobacterium myrsinacearum]MBA8878796.1 hypothetical protein [Phyllobacterium myrsinacearum]
MSAFTESVIVPSAVIRTAEYQFRTLRQQDMNHSLKMIVGHVSQRRVFVFFENAPVYPVTLNRRQVMRHVKENGDLSNWMTCSVILFGAMMVAAVVFAI